MHRTTAVLSCNTVKQREDAAAQIVAEFTHDIRSLYICSCKRGNVSISPNEEPEDTLIIRFLVGLMGPNREEELSGIFNLLVDQGIIVDYEFEEKWITWEKFLSNT